MSKHTKGPWEVDSESYLGDKDEHYHSITAGCGYHVTGDDDGFEISGCMSTANARLIASAPCLLDALEALLAVADQYDLPLSDPERISARLAIAKARGEA